MKAIGNPFANIEERTPRFASLTIGSWEPAAQGWRRLDSVRTHMALCAAVGATSLWLRTGFPVVALGSAVDDDRLFVRTAHYLAAGQWLGPYDNLTLVKGMFYPLFICLASFAAIPLKIAEHCVYLAVSALIAWIAMRASQRRWLGSLLFAALAFNPALWNPSLARVIREGLYISLSPAVIALGVLSAFPPTGRGFARSALLGCLLGLTGAGFWLTREEGLWLAPAFASILLIAIVDAARPRSANSPATARPMARAFPMPSVAVSMIVAALAFGACSQTVMSMNRDYYGVAILNEVKSQPFERAYGSLARIKPQAWRRYVVFPSDVRQKAYAASPAARELAPFLEGSLNRRWHAYGCDQMELAARDCPEILSGWFFWALRDAVAAAGYYRSAVDAQEYYIRLANQIDAGCQDGSLACLPRRTGLAPPFRWSYLVDSIHPAAALAEILLTMQQGPIGPGFSAAAASDMASFSEMVGPVSPWRRMHGWVAAVVGVPGIYLTAPPDQTVSSSTTLGRADDVKSAYPNTNAVRFNLDYTCPADSCLLVAQTSDGDRATVPIRDIYAGMMVHEGPIRLFVDSVSAKYTGIATDLREAPQLPLARVIARGYALAMPVLAVLGACGIAVAGIMCRWRRPPAALFALAVASLLAVGCRIALLAYLDATSLPATSLLYASPATPFVMVVAVVGIYVGLAGLRRRGV